jgi:GDPmannose 4,6-dehydratase
MKFPMRHAVIFGVTGQDGSYLARFLLDKGYRVFGARPTTSPTNSANLAELGIAECVEFIPVDYSDSGAIKALLSAVAPDEIYNLAAQSSVARSFDEPVQTGEIDGLFVTRLLQAIREAAPQARFFQASSSEIFGAQSGTLTEEAPLQPRNPYGIAKAYAHWMTGSFRQSFAVHASSGILFNHESPLRGPQFVTRKITMAVARIKYGLQDSLTLGNVEVERDWGYAGEYVEAMWRMLQQDAPGDFIIATGKLRRLREWLEIAFAAANLNHEEYVRLDTALLRPTETLAMQADPSKAERELGWRAQVSLEELIARMVEADLRRVRNDVKSEDVTENKA